MSDLVATHVEDGVGIITFNRPEKHNALDDEMFEQFDAALTWAQEAQAVRCVLLRGEGKSFSSGRDTRTLNWPADTSPYTFVRHHQEARLRQRSARKPSVAALHGYVLGGACEIALAADIRICADDAQLALPEVGFGIMTDTGGCRWRRSWPARPEPSGC